MFITGIGTAAPPQPYKQSECWEALQLSPQFSRLAQRSRAILRKILTGNNGIETRHLALEEISRLQTEFPHLPIRILDTTNDAPNGKVGSLEILAAAAKYETLLVNDGDIVVPPDYLKRVIGLLADEKVGLVTCLYKGRPEDVTLVAVSMALAQPGPVVPAAGTAKGTPAAGDGRAHTDSNTSIVPRRRRKCR